MNGQESKAVFDVFLCHNSADKPTVREIAQKLKKECVKPWLDEEQILPGTSWQTVLGQQINRIKSAAIFVGDGGIGPWQDQEVQSFLNRFVNRKCAVIPVILSSTKATPELPWPLENLHRVDFRTDSYPLQRLIWGITGQKPAELADVPDLEKPATIREATERRLIAGGGEQTRSDNAISEKRLYPRLRESPDPDNATQLSILRKRVMEYWVDGLLKRSLYNEVLISLGKREIGNAVDAPWKYTVEVSDAMNSGPLDDRDVSVIYDATGLLLILGEPGSGKTTTLLDLARTLLERAQDDITERVPIVLNLSSWKKQPLPDWISNELSEKYRVPRKIAHIWLQRGYLLPLLDGLDEIETLMQPDCVAAINSFIEEFQPSGLVVCCRLNEYRWLPKRLKLNGAICIEPLSSEEVSKYLVAGGPKLAALREAVGADPVLQELALSPLMLSIMSLAYQGSGSDDIIRQKWDFEEQLQHIFGLYVEQMFKRKGPTSLAFRKEKIIGWLSWLAGKMREHSQSILLVEVLQPSWLGTGAKTDTYGAVALLISMLIGVLIGGMIGGASGGVYGAAIGGVQGAAIGGFAVGSPHLGGGSLNHIALVKTISWKWNQFWKRANSRIIIGPTVVLIGLLIVGRSTGLIGAMVLIIKLVSGGFLLFGLINSLAGGFTAMVKEGKASPNQGIKLSLKNFLVVFLVTSLVVELIVGLSAGLILGLYVGLIVGLNRGGSAVIKHYVLRMILSLNGYVPLNFIKFLDQCAKLIFLKKVGGGYIFIHRMLLDYFADLPQSTRGGNGETESVRS